MQIKTSKVTIEHDSAIFTLEDPHVEVLARMLVAGRNPVAQYKVFQDALIEVSGITDDAGASLDVEQFKRAKIPISLATLLAKKYIDIGTARLKEELDTDSEQAEKNVESPTDLNGSSIGLS